MASRGSRYEKRCVCNSYSAAMRLDDRLARLGMESGSELFDRRTVISWLVNQEFDSKAPRCWGDADFAATLHSS